MREKSRCEGDLCQWAALYRADSLSCQSLGFLVEARKSTEPILEKKELNDYTSTHKMYLFVILPFDCPRREGRTPFYGL